MTLSDLRSIAYPTLDDAKVAELVRRTDARSVSYSDGEALFRCDQPYVQCFVICSGAVKILDESGDEPKTVTVHQKGEFTGDADLLSGVPSLVAGVAEGDTKTYAIDAERLRSVLNEWPALGDLFLQAFIARRQLLRELPGYTGLRVIGSRHSPDLFRIRDFLARNCVLYTWYDVETDLQMSELLSQFGVTKADLPVVACGHKLLLRNPSNRELAERLGIRKPLERTVYDLVVVGAGPAGLAAAVYAASEGLNTVVLERVAPGGQASSSMRIENYLGFPTGITGRELADRAALQVAKFGARITVPTPAVSLYFRNDYALLRLEDGDTLIARSLLIASGAEYRRLPAEGCQRFEGCGVFYAATPNEAQHCRDSRMAVVVGGGNSAGQAAVFLAEHAKRVLILIRGDDLYKSMSAYLAHRIERIPNIEVRYNTEIVRMSGDDYLGSIVIRNTATGEEETLETTAVFSFIGAAPRTDWLPPEVETDGKGFIRTGAEMAHSPHWNARRNPFLLEASHPGVFAAGDVRSGSVKRVASAVGEGAMAVQFVHEYLKEK